MKREWTVIVGEDGILRLDAGAEFAGKAARVVIEEQKSEMSREEWHAFIHRTAGSIDDPTFIRHPPEVGGSQD